MNPSLEMNTKKLFVILVILQNIFETTTACEFSLLMTTRQRKLLVELEHLGTFNFVFDYVIFQEPADKSLKKFYDELRIPNVIFVDPAVFIELYDYKNSIQLRVNSNYSSATFVNENYTAKVFDVNLESMNLKKCGTELSSSAWKVNSNGSLCIIMLACQVTKKNPKGFIKVSKKVIFLTDQDYDLTHFTNYNFSGLNFDQKKVVLHPNYEGESFCVCDFLDRYYNNCNTEKDKEKEDKFKIFILIVMVIIISYILFEIFQNVHLSFDYRNWFRRNRVIPFNR